MSRSSAHAVLRIFRLVHLYLGIFTAPALIFFAFTGGLQTFSLHETTRGSSYKPPAWAATLAQIHKKQTPVVPVRRRSVGNAGTQAPLPEARPQQSLDLPTAKTRGAAPDPAASLPAATSAQQDPSGMHHPLPLKVFFLIVSVGLLLSTITGIYMAYKYRRNCVWITGLLILGTVLPIVLLFV
jgi:hypothetical protein